VIRKIEEKGGVAKVCGAGGKKVRSGMVLCYHDDLSVIEKIADGCKTPLIQTIFGDEGIRIESTSTHHSL
jgi:hypothetical protein